MRKSLFACLAILMTSLMLSGCFGSDASADTPPATAVEDQFTPVVTVAHTAKAVPFAGSDGRYHLVYELRLMNSRAAPATVLGVDALDATHPERELGGLRSQALLGSLRTLDNHYANSAQIEVNATRLLLMHLSFATRDAVPSAVTHRVHVLAGGLDNSQPTPTDQTYLSAPLAIGSDTVPALGPPLRGAGWIAINGCCEPTSVHRATGLPVNGDIRFAQRFAIDFMRLNEQGYLLSGSPTEVSSYAAYGAELLAAADGTVVAALSTLDDQAPPTLPAPSTITLATADGNHVLIDIGGGLYLFYAHMQKESLRVKVGDKVRRGDVLGLLGNSGNSSAPHLHFHVVDGPSVLGGNGVPYVFDSWLQSGQATDAMVAVNGLESNLSGARISPPQPRSGVLPMDMAIIDFAP